MERRERIRRRLRGPQKRKSSDRIKLASLRPSADRPTLVPCPVCGGHESIKISEAEHGIGFVVKKCRWCDGIGSVTDEIVELFQCWKRILSYNRSRGACGNK